MRIRSIGASIFVWLLAPLSAADSDWFQKSMADIESAASLPPEEAIELLYPRLSLGRSVSLTEEQKTVYLRAREVLLATQGHALHSQRRMDRLLSALDREPSTDLKALIYYNDTAQNEELPHLGYSYEEAMESLRNLKFLPTSESVSVLASYLKHPEGRNGTMASGQPYPMSPRGISITAAGVLTEMGIEHPPVRPPMTAEDIWTKVDAWAEWWDEVKSGKRTYRFQGSPVEYGPDGPVDPSTIKHLNRRPPTNTNATTESSPSEPEAKDPKRSKSFLALITVALALLFIGAYRAVIFRKARSDR
jgi:hypothetical protein